MADQDFNVKVITTADLRGIKETEAGLKRLSIDEANRLGRLASERRRALRSALSEVPDELKSSAPSVVEEIEKIAPATLFSGINIAKARQEATFLARELATGVPTTRTLSSLLGALGPYIAGAVVAGFALNKALTANAERQLAINRELDSQLTKVTDLSQKWSAAAKGARSYEDVLKLTTQIIPVLDEAGNKFREFQNKGISAWKQLSDLFTAGIPGAGKVFENSFQTQANVLAENAQRLRDSAIAATKLGLAYKSAFDAEKVKPLDEAVGDLTKKIQYHLNLAKQLGPKNIESYNTEIRLAEMYKNELLEISQIQKEARQDLEKAAPQVKSILNNEQAAAVARKQGREREADQYQKAAEDFKKGALPIELEQASRLEERLGLKRGQPANPTANEIIKSIETGNTKLDTLIDLFR